MSLFSELENEMNRGLNGLNSGIPMGFRRLNQYIGIRKRIYTVVFGATGSGKSALVHDAYILNPFDWYIENMGAAKPKVILFSMERSKIYVATKWLSRRIFLDYGSYLSIGRILGWSGYTRLTPAEQDLVKRYGPYLDELTRSILHIHEGARSAADIYRIIKEYAMANGKEEQLSEHKKIYIPNDENEIVMPIADHLGLTKLGKEMKSKKEAIDTVSEYFQYFRDHCGYSPVGVSQLTRELGSVQYQKMDNFEPTLDHVKESGRPAEDADNVISLFDPLRYNTDDRDYRARNFVNPNSGSKHFRSLKILKNTYGEDDIRVGMAFWGASGIFKELPRKDEMESFDYSSIFDGTYFKQ